VLGLFDNVQLWQESGFEGPGALANSLQRLLRQPDGCGGKGASSIPDCLNDRAGLNLNFDVTRLSETAFWAGGARRPHCTRFAWFAAASWALISPWSPIVNSCRGGTVMMGPQSRALLHGSVGRYGQCRASLQGDSPRDRGFGWVLGRAHRVSYVGEAWLGALMSHRIRPPQCVRGFWRTWRTIWPQAVAVCNTLETVARIEKA